jgi:hypothetical protein
MAMDPAPSAVSNKLFNPTLWLVILLLLAAALRLFDISDEPFELHPTRQFRALIIARGFYYPTADNIPADKVEFARAQAGQVGLIEPSILEFLTAQLYKLVGGEVTWIGRMIPITAWLLGGLAVFALSRQIGSNLAAFISLSYYLFLPFGTGLSRVLMVDPIMTAGTAASLWALYLWSQRQETRFAVIAGLLTGVTILLKSVSGIILIVPFALFLLTAFPIKELLKNRQVWLIFLLAALPSAAWYYYGLVIDGRLKTQFKGRFFPEIWTDITFFKSWGVRIIREFNLLAFGAALFGFLLAKSKPLRLLLFGWWAGYFIYGMVFAYYTWTHDYYHLPMVPLTAVSLAPTIVFLENLLKNKSEGRWAAIAAGGICASMVIFGGMKSIQFLSETDFRDTRAGLEQLGGEIASLPPGTVIGLTNDYETSFSFYTFQNAVHWPTTGDLNFRELQGSSETDFEQRWQLTDDAAYFFITDFSQLEKQPLLAERLVNFRLVSETEIFSLYELSSNSP